ncbi:MAG: helix-turn-helix transcriptional regulator [Micropruina sp.]|nr:helix-turn-helix transcriptional regulator [Micropruina sp.]
MLRQERERRGLTQAELAERSGVSRQLLIKIEKGHPGAEIGKIMAIVKALGGGVVFEELPPSPPSAFDLDQIIWGEK